MANYRRKILSETDRAVWEAYVRQVGALPTRSYQNPTATMLATASKPLPISYHPLQLPSELSTAEVTVGSRPGGIDNSTWTKFRSGKVPSQRTLDLHGRTVQHALLALQSFLHKAHAEQIRCVEIITGKGTGEQGGAIRRELPLWLNLPPLRSLVLGAVYSHAANVGAVRLLIRRLR